MDIITITFKGVGYCVRTNEGAHIFNGLKVNKGEIHVHTPQHCPDNRLVLVQELLSSPLHWPKHALHLKIITRSSL